MNPHPPLEPSSLTVSEDATVLISKRIPIAQARAIRALAYSRGMSVTDLMGEAIDALAAQGAGANESNTGGVSPHESEGG